MNRSRFGRSLLIVCVAFLLQGATAHAAEVKTRSRFPRLERVRGFHWLSKFTKPEAAGGLETAGLAGQPTQQHQLARPKALEIDPDRVTDEHIHRALEKAAYYRSISPEGRGESPVAHFDGAQEGMFGGPLLQQIREEAHAHRTADPVGDFVNHRLKIVKEAIRDKTAPPTLLEALHAEL